MFKNEWRKVFGSRLVVLSVFIFFLINACVCYFQTKPNSKKLPDDAIADFFEIYLSDESKMQEEYLQMQDFLSEQECLWAEQMALGNREYEMQTWENKYAPVGFTDKQLFQCVISAIEYAQNYPSKIEHAIKAAYIQIINSSAETIDSESYIYRYQAEIIQHYQNVYNQIKLTPEYVRGWNKYFSYDFMSVFVLISTVVISGFVFTNEYQLGTIPLIYSTKNGRLRTVLTKVSVVYGSSALLCILFCVETLLIINITTGLSTTELPIQSLSNFIYCPYVVTIKEYLLIDFVFKLLASFVLTTIAAAFSAGFCNYLFTYIGSLGLLGLDYLFFILRFPSGENLVRALNLMSISTSQSFLDRYRAVRFGNTPIAYDSVILVTYIVAIIVLTTFIIIKCCHSDTVKHSKTRINIYPLPFFKPKTHLCSASRAYSVSLFAAELYKSTIATRFLCVVLALFLVKCFVTSSAFQSKNSYTDEIYREYTSTLAGPINNDKRAYVQNERSFITETLNNYDTVSTSYKQGAIDLDTYRNYLSDYNYAFSHDEILKRIEKHIVYIDAIKTEGKEAWFVYDTGWLRLLTNEFDWSLYALIIILGSNAFASEYSSRTSSAGFQQILRTTKHGRKKTFHLKSRTALLLSVVLSLVWSVIDFLAIMNIYELPAFNSPIWSIEYFANIEYTITIWQFLVFYVCIKTLAHTVLALLTLAIANIFRKSISAALFVTTLTLLPRILSILGMPYTKIIDYVDILEATPILLRNIEGATFVLSATICSTCVLVFSKRMWNK